MACTRPTRLMWAASCYGPAALAAPRHAHQLHASTGHTHTRQTNLPRASALYAPQPPLHARAARQLSHSCASAGARWTTPAESATPVPRTNDKNARSELRAVRLRLVTRRFDNSTPRRRQRARVAPSQPAIRPLRCNPHSTDGSRNPRYIRTVPELWSSCHTRGAVRLGRSHHRAGVLPSALGRRHSKATPGTKRNFCTDDTISL